MTQTKFSTILVSKTTQGIFSTTYFRNPVSSCMESESCPGTKSPMCTYRASLGQSSRNQKETNAKRSVFPLRQGRIYSTLLQYGVWVAISLKPTGPSRPQTPNREPGRSNEVIRDCRVKSSDLHASTRLHGPKDSPGLSVELQRTFRLREQAKKTAKITAR